MTLEADPPTAEELLGRLADIPHTGSYERKDIGSLGVLCQIKKTEIKNSPEEEKKKEESTKKQG